ncbi:NADH-quinone oxidoreductase subunit N [Halobacteriovorax sp. GB3]|uniref:NADH-quinone oxidoreductase subunit N n=1 Tax=Halobacteriovorax sp. GB3 TaxID=2719615 RepID=UPI00235E596A|nr:NADH-quinone oxidoreductase subunit N [Halobacteriovorax sp. GB3]MDD0854700.1 NADH-quinone oxidoreductase subunit N [Halobacteriovorax sp. GB3]
MALTYLANIGRYVPELIMCFTMVGLIMIEAAYSDKEKGSSKGYLFGFAYMGLFFSLVYLVQGLSKDPVTLFTGSVVIDSFSTLAKIVMVLGTAFVIYLSRQSKDIYEDMKSEFVIIAVGVLVGGMLLSSANNMLILYIGIETLSILSYVLASLKKNDTRSSEAGLKYVLYGGVSAGIMLFGISHIFGMTGTIQFTEIMQILPTLDAQKMAILLPSFLLFFVGIGYKISCVPFHMWTPDVYEGSPLPVTTFFAIVPKVAGIAVLTRVTMVFFGGEPTALQMTWVGTLSVVAALTMTVGNVSAIGQRSVKRMLAYSSISHAGVMIAAATVLKQTGATSILFYLITYMFMTIVAFFIVSIVQDKYGNDHFERFNGLMNKYPVMAICMAIVMFSLAGLPPLSGFVAKFNILAAILKEKYYVLAVILGLNSVVSLYYYLKIVRLMVFKPAESDEKIEGFGFVNQTFIAALCVPVVVLGVFWEKIILIADGAKIFIK